MANIRELSDYRPDGTRLGQAAADLISFHGSTPVAQIALSATAAVVTTAATSSTPFGYTSAQATSIVSLINALRAALISKGLAST